MGADGHIAVLNFASATNPGGGFKGGAQAQEESLARSSALYPCLAKFVDCHYSLPLKSGLYTHSLIFSPLVPFFKDDDGHLCPPRLCSVVTSPACNAKKINDKSDKRLVAQVCSAMRERVRRVFHLAAAENVRVLILGAWGCGVFGGCPAQMAELFKEAITDPKFSGIRFIFAIPDARMRATFNAVLNRATPAPNILSIRSRNEAHEKGRHWKGRSHHRSCRHTWEDGDPFN